MENRIKATRLPSEFSSCDTLLFQNSPQKCLRGVFAAIFEIVGKVFGWAWEHLGGILFGAIVGGFFGFQSGYERGHQDDRQEGYRDGCLKGDELVDAEKVRTAR